MAGGHGSGKKADKSIALRDKLAQTLAEADEVDRARTARIEELKMKLATSKEAQLDKYEKAKARLAALKKARDEAC